MEDNPDIPADDGPAGDDGTGSGYTAVHRASAAVLLIGACLLAYVCLDVMANGRLTGMLSAAPETGESAP